MGARHGAVRTTAEPIRTSWPRATPGGPIAAARWSVGAPRRRGAPRFAP